MKRFKLLAGKHNENGVTYSRGEIITTAGNLLKHNRGSRKFEFLDETEDEVTEPVTDEEEYEEEEDDGLDASTIAELRAMAVTDGIDLTGKTSKNDIIATIREAYAG